MPARIVSAVFTFELPGLRDVLSERQGVRLVNVLLELFDSWGKTLGFTVTSLDLEQNDEHLSRFVALLELKLNEAEAQAYLATSRKCWPTR